jgi:RNA polymerase sigma-70 factor (ECF subfamily)
LEPRLTRFAGDVRHPNVDQLARPAFVAEADQPLLALQQLVKSACRGDALAQTTLIRDYTPRLAGLIRTIVRQTSVIEDLVQMSFIKMLRALPCLRDPAVFEPWLFRIARSTALDHLRRQKCRPVMVADEIELMNAVEVRHDEAVTEISEALERALAHLAPKDQRLMRMLVQGHDYHTLARREGLSVGAVKARICRIRGFLRVAVGTATGTRQASPRSSSAARSCADCAVRCSSAEFQAFLQIPQATRHRQTTAVREHHDMLAVEGRLQVLDAVKPHDGRAAHAHKLVRGKLLLKCGERLAHHVIFTPGVQDGVVARGLDPVDCLRAHEAHLLALAHGDAGKARRRGLRSAKSDRIRRLTSSG